MKNTFKNGIEPRRVVEPVKPVQKLNPPVFEEELINFHNPHIFWGMALEKQDRGNTFNHPSR